jgi:hypothetical protein
MMNWCQKWEFIDWTELLDLRLNCVVTLPYHGNGTNNGTNDRFLRGVKEMLVEIRDGHKAMLAKIEAGLEER